MSQAVAYVCIESRVILQRSIAPYTAAISALQHMFSKSLFVTILWSNVQVVISMMPLAFPPVFLWPAVCCCFIPPTTLWSYKNSSTFFDCGSLAFENDDPIQKASSYTTRAEGPVEQIWYKVKSMWTPDHFSHIWFLNWCHKIEIAQLYRTSLCSVALQFPSLE